MANSYTAEKLAIQTELATARAAVTAEVQALREEFHARRSAWHATVGRPVKLLLTVAGSWLAYEVLKKRRLPEVSLGVLAFRWLRPRLTAWLLRKG